MNWVMLFSVLTGFFAICTAISQSYKDKKSDKDRIIDKNEIIKLQKENNDTLNKTNLLQEEIILSNKNLIEANEQLKSIQKEQNQNLKNQSELEGESNFNRFKKTFSETFFLRPWKVSEFEKFTQQEQIEFMGKVKSLLGAELSNPYLVSNKILFTKWLSMYQTETSFAGEVTIQETGHKLNNDELLKYNNKIFMEYVKKYLEFEENISFQIGVWY